MDESFQFDRDAAVDFPDIGQAHFPGHDDAAGTEVMPELDTGPVGRIGLGRNVDGQFRHELAGQTENPRIGNEQGVYAYIPQKAQVIRQSREVFIVRENIDRHMDPFSPFMGIGHGFFQLIPGEIVTEGAETE